MRFRPPVGVTRRFATLRKARALRLIINFVHRFRVVVLRRRGLGDFGLILAFEEAKKTIAGLIFRCCREFLAVVWFPRLFGYAPLLRLSAA